MKVQKSVTVTDGSVFYNSCLLSVMYVSYLQLYNTGIFQNWYLDNHFCHCCIWYKMSQVFWLLLIHFSDVMYQIKKLLGDIKAKSGDKSSDCNCHHPALFFILGLLLLLLLSLSELSSNKL